MIVLENVKSELCDTFNINSIPTNDANTIRDAFCNYVILILDSNVPQRYDKQQLVLVTI